MQQTTRITHQELNSFLSDHLHTPIRDIEPVGQGEWSQTFFFTTGEQKKVIRFSAYDEDYRVDRYAAQFSSPRLPIPCIEEIGQAFGRYFAISARVEGKLIDDLGAEEMQAMLPALLDLLDALREVDGSQTHGYGGIDACGNAAAESWREYLTFLTPDSPGSRLGGWKQNLARNPDAHALYQAGRERLLTLAPRCPEARHLIHNDLLHFNLIVNDNRVAGVIDWGCAMWGDFLYDLAMITAWQFYYPAMAGIDFIASAREYFHERGVELADFYERIQCYQLHLLLDSLAYNAWKGDPTNLGLTMRRLQEVLGQSE